MRLMWTQSRRLSVKAGVWSSCRPTKAPSSSLLLLLAVFVSPCKWKEPRRSPAERNISPIKAGRGSLDGGGKEVFYFQNKSHCQRNLPMWNFLSLLFSVLSGIIICSTCIKSSIHPSIHFNTHFLLHSGSSWSAEASGSCQGERQSEFTI